MKHSFTRLAVFTLLALAAAPDARGQWVDTPGPCGGYIHSSCVDTSGVLYAATFDNGVYRSLDGGKTWEEANNGLHGGDVFEVFAVGATRSGDVFATPLGGGIYRTRDHGLHWQYLQPSIGMSCIYEMPNGEYLAGSDGKGLFRSTDGGDTWVHSDSGLSQTPTVYQIQQGRDGTLFAICDNYNWATSPAYIGAFYFSTDAGHIWNQIGIHESPEGIYGSLVVDTLISPKSDYLFLGRHDDYGSGFSGVLRSSNGGRTWDTMLTQSLVYSLVLDQQGRIYAASLGCIFSSSDGGSTWSRSQDICACDINTLTCLPSDDLLAGTVGCGTFIKRASDSGWSLSNVGLSQSAVTAILYLKSGLLFAGTQLTGLWVTSDNGDVWSHIAGQHIPADVSALAVDGEGTIFWGSQEGLYVSSDTGLSWKGLQTVGAVYAIAVTDSGAIAVGSDSGFFILSRAGASPKFIDKTKGNLGPSTAPNPPSSPPIIERIAKGPRGDLFGGGSFWSWNGSLYSGYWERAKFCVNLSTFKYFAPDYILASVDSFLYYADVNSRFSRMGPSGVGHSLNFDASGTQCVITDSAGGIILGRYADGIYRSTDNGSTWQHYNNGNTNGYTNCLARDASGGIIFAGSGDAKKGIKGGGVFRLQGSALSGVRASFEVRNSLTCYPNPLTSSTTITLSSPASGFAEITVVNLLGIEVARVFAGAVDAGERSVVWQKPSGLPAGMYECIVRMNGHAERVGMIVE